ncbi:MAG: hypothetical protein ACW98D_18905 [Promethearchaeota archaeon]|jgi:hypothetical protein
MRKDLAKDYTNVWNQSRTFYIIKNAWCAHCQKNPPSGIKHAGWYWTLRNSKVSGSIIFALNAPNERLFLISNDGTQVAMYVKTESYIPDKQKEISYEKLVGRHKK